MRGIQPLSIIVVTYQSARALAACLDSLHRHAPGAEVLVVDNGSQDDTRERAAAHPAVTRVLHLPENPGFGTAANHGMRAATGELLAVLNPDVVLTGPVFDEMVAAAGPEGLDLAAPWMADLEGNPTGSGYAASGPGKWLLQLLGGAAMADRLRRGAGPGWLAVLPLGTLGRGVDARTRRRRVAADWLCGACLVMRRPVFEALGGFDEEIFLYGEDEELGYRARQRGFRVEVLPAGPVLHAVGAPGNFADPALFTRVLASMRRMIDRTNPGRPLRRALMRWLLPTWMRRVAARAGAESR